VAEQWGDTVARKMMFRIAEDYERLADHARQRTRDVSSKLERRSPRRVGEPLGTWRVSPAWFREFRSKLLNICFWLPRLRYLLEESMGTLDRLMCSINAVFGRVRLFHTEASAFADHRVSR